MAAGRASSFARSGWLRWSPAEELAAQWLSLLLRARGITDLRAYSSWCCGGRGGEQSGSEEAGKMPLSSRVLRYAFRGRSPRCELSFEIAAERFPFSAFNHSGDLLKKV